MAREILFRGKRIDNGEWIEGDLINNYNGRKFIGEIIIDDYKGNCADKYEVGIGFYEVIPETVGQYTGLTDKNGQKNFEGDIICFQDDDGEHTNYVVYWSENEWAITDTNQYGAWKDHLDKFVVEFSQVIGNIYDNPELLEV